MELAEEVAGSFEVSVAGVVLGARDEGTHNPPLAVDWSRIRTVDLGR